MQTEILEALRTESDCRWYPQQGNRVLDIVSTLFFILLFSPVLAIAAIAISITSKGPILLRQPRVGKNGELFNMLKFRTMRHDRSDDAITHHANQLAATGMLFKVDSDPRVTPIGALLRKFSIDELPQLINVLNGEMSLVGPRPLLPFMVAPYPIENQLRTAVLPGLTGLWQISARGESSSVLQMIRYDMEYQADISFRNDLRIVGRTIPLVLRGTGVK